MGTSRTIRPVAIILCIGVGASAGCTINRRYANNAIQQLPHSEVTIEYATATAPVQLAEAQTDAESKPTLSPQTLQIFYPHPSPKLGRKYAELVLREESSGGEAESKTGPLVTAVRRLVAPPDPADEGVLRTSLPRQELEHLLRALVADGFFDDTAREGDVELEVKLGSRTTAKSWDRVPAFDQLIERIHAEKKEQMRGDGPPPVVPPTPTELLPPEFNVDDDIRPASRQFESLHESPPF